MQQTHNRHAIASRPHRAKVKEFPPLHRTYWLLKQQRWSYTTRFNLKGTLSRSGVCVCGCVCVRHNVDGGVNQYPSPFMYGGGPHAAGRLGSEALMGRRVLMRMNHRHRGVIPGSCLFIFMAVYLERDTQTERERERCKGRPIKCFL